MKFAVFTTALASAASIFTGAMAAPQPDVAIAERAAAPQAAGPVSVFDIASSVKDELNSANAQLRKFPLIYSETTLLTMHNRLEQACQPERPGPQQPQRLLWRLEAALQAGQHRHAQRRFFVVREQHNQCYPRNH